MLLIARGLAAVVLTIVISLLVLVALLFVDLATGNSQTAGYHMASMLFPTLLILGPGILVACLNSENTKKVRLWAAVRAIAVTLAFYIAWQRILGPLIGSTFFSGSAKGLQYAIAMDALIATLMMFVSGVLVAYLLPSNQSKPIGPPPKAIKNFELLMYAYLFLMFVNSAISYDKGIQLTQEALAQEAAHPLLKSTMQTMFGGPFLIGMFTITFLIILFMTISISRQGWKNMRLVMFAYYIIGIVASVPAVPQWLSVLPITAIIFIALLVIQGVALYFAFAAESNAWFDGGRVKPDVLATA